MKYLLLSKGKAQTKVDDDDYDSLSKWKWQLHPRGYAIRSIWIKNLDGSWKHTSVRLHAIVNKTPKGMDTDHINGDKLDNRKINLRSCTHAQNTRNRVASARSKSGFRGVVWREKSKDYVAYINYNNKRIWLKTYHKLEDAVKARRAAELKYHGEYASQRG